MNWLTSPSRFAPALLLFLLVSFDTGRGAHADGFPNRTVKIVVPFPAGGTVDTISRLLADRLSRKWQQPVIVENLSGASGNIGAELVFRSAPDGYVLMSSPPGPLVINQSLYRNLAFDPAKFTPIVVTAEVPDVLVINQDKLNVSNLGELIEFLKANPDHVTAATQGVGTTSHLASELFQLMAEVKLRNIPYRGSSPAFQGLISGDVDMMFANLGVVLPSIASGKLKLLAVASPHRVAALPDTPAISETLPGFEAVAWYGIVAPPNTEARIVEKINADVNELLREPELQERLNRLSAVVLGGTAEDASRYIHEEVDRWSNVIKAANISLR